MVSGEQKSPKWRLLGEREATEQKFFLELVHCQVNQLLKHLCFD